jgi:streptogramin lyase
MLVRPLLTLIGAILCVGLVTFTAEAKSPPPGTGTGSAPTNVLILFDKSGSMNSAVPSGDNRYPVDVAFDSNNNIYVAKLYDTIEKFNSAGNFQFEWGGNDGTSANGKFDYTFAVDVDSDDNVYVSDYGHNRVQKFNSSGFFMKNFALTTGPAQGVALDSSDNVYVVDGNGKVEKFNSSGTLLTTWSDTGGVHIAIDDSDNVYVTNYSAKTVKKYNTSGVLQSTFSLTYNPYGIGTDHSGNFYVTAIDTNRVYYYQPDGTQIAVYGGTGGGSGKFRSPRGVDVNSADKVYVADNQNHRIQSTDGNTFLTPNLPETRMEQSVKVLKEIVSDSNITESANFGLITWSSSSSLDIEISDTGASEIYTFADTINGGGNTDLDDAMETAYNYWTGADSPYVEGATCQENINIIISDGDWTDTTASDTAEQLYEEYGIRTFVVGFLTGESTNYVTISDAGGSSPDSPLYATNWQALYDVLTGYISQASISNLTFTAPTIIPGVVNEDFIVQSTFTYKRDHQWKGRLKKYSLDSEGDIGTELWDAGDVLNATAAADRNLFTVDSTIPFSLNNFTTANRDRLRVGLDENLGTALTDDEVNSLINFVRGEDSYNEYPSGVDDEDEALISGERWKLADIYHSRALVVGPPSAFTSETADTNTEAYYRFANGYNTFKESENCGGSCATRDEIIVAGSNGGMLHAFLSEDGSELWGFIPPSVLPVLKDMMPDTDPDQTISIYGVDGSPTVKDIYYGGSWHTVLMSGLRQGGHSYFALDITDVHNPEHLFTFAFNTLTNTVSYWAADGTRTDYEVGVDTIPAEYDYSDLGESWSQPVILKLPISGVDKWVALIGGGFNNGIATNYGGNLTILDLENGGQILEKITISDTVAGNGIQTSAPPRLTVVTPDTTSTFTKNGAFAYFSDLEGKLWKINLTDEGTMYETTRMFLTEATSDNDRYTYFDNSATVSSDGKLVQFYGTGNQQSLERVDADIQNRAFGIYDQDYPNFTATTEKTIADLFEATDTCPDVVGNGWYIDFDPNEKITARITVDGNLLFMSRFTPDPTDICSGGSATLTEHDYTCGGTLRETELGSGIATDAVIYKGKLYMGISNDSADTDGSLPDGFTKVGNLIVGTPVESPRPRIEVESWWEEF